MTILRFAMRAGTQRQFADLASRIAQQCYEPVLRRVRDLAPDASEPEVRGYVRVRAAAVVDRAVDRVLGEHRRADPTLRPRLIARVSELLVDAIAAKHGGSRRRRAA